MERYKQQAAYNTDQRLMNLIFDTAMNNGLPPQNNNYDFIKECRKKNPMVLIASASRSGSTFLTRAFGSIADLQFTRMCMCFPVAEHDLYLPALCFANDYPCIGLSHMKATPHSCALINLFGIKTIVTVRNLVDTVVSCARYVRRGCRNDENFHTGYSSASMAWIDLNMAYHSDEKLIDMVIDLYLPWYINFYVSWYTVSQRNEVYILWVNYEETKSDTAGVIQKLLDFCQLKPQTNKKLWPEIFKEFPSSSEPHHGANDKFQSKDWKAKITPNQLARINNLASYYPDVDFARLGIAAPNHRQESSDYLVG